MTPDATSVPAPPEAVATPELTHEVPSGLVWAWRDSWTEAMRHLRIVPATPIC